MLLRGTMLIAVALALLAPAAASAASKPEVRTGAAASITPTTATLNGRVDPNNAETTYFFQSAPRACSAPTPPRPPRARGAASVAVSVPVSGLAPATTYHYRLVAQNRFGITRGERRTFKTKVQPLGVTLAANPNPVAPGGSSTLVGQLTGTNNANRDVVLQSNPFPYTQGFVNAGNAQVTDAAGNFSFAVLSVPVTTQFRVVMAQRPEVTSPIVVVGAALQVRTDAKKVARHRHSVSVRFRGSDLAAARRRAREHPEAARRQLVRDRAHGREGRRRLEVQVPNARAALPLGPVPRRRRGRGPVRQRRGPRDLDQGPPLT